MMPAQETFCPNLNHCRTNVPVRICPECGEIVNDSIPVRQCDEQEHTAGRRNRQMYCMHCGEQLVQGT